MVEHLDQYLVESEIKEHDQQADALRQIGVPDVLANKVCRLTSVFSGLDLAQVSEQLDKPFELVARLYYVMGDRLSLHWFLKQINNQPVDNHWQALARASFREDLDWQQRMLTASIVSEMDPQHDAETGLAQWMDDHAVILGRWQSIVDEFKVGSVHEFAKFSVALRELSLLNLN